MGIHKVSLPEQRKKRQSHYTLDFVLTQDFFPEIGGAHLWLYEVYKRWPNPVTVLTRDYSYSPELISQQTQFDCMNHGSIEVVRRKLEIEDIDLFSPTYLIRLFGAIKLIQGLGGKKPIRLHCLRAFPEGIVALGVKLLQLSKCKFITYAHGEELLVARTSRQLQLLCKMVYKKSNLVIANSNSTKTLIREVVAGANISVIHPGVDVQAFDIPDGQRIAYRRQWGWPSDTIILVTVARMEPRKNHANVIRAMAELRKEGIPLGYVVGGTGEEENKLRKLVRELGLSPWVKFLGRVPEKEKPLCYASTDIHIMPSIQIGPMIEGFGIVFLEAAAAGIPSIAGKVGGQAEAVLDRRTGLVVDGSRITDLKDAIRCLATNEQTRRKMGEQARLWARDHDWLKVAEKTVSQVERACGL